MNTRMRHIDGFDKMILNSFKEVIERAGLRFELHSTEFGDDYRLIANRCEIKFNYDRGDLGCILIDRENGQRYLAGLVYKFLYPGESLYIPSIDDPVANQIEMYAQMIGKKLFHVVSGDFSWAIKDPLRKHF